MCVKVKCLWYGIFCVESIFSFAFYFTLFCLLRKPKNIAHDLAGSSQGGFNDPYIRIFISPEVDSRKRQTNIHRNEPNPYFDEHFKFPVSQEDLKEKVLILQVRFF